MKKLSRPLLICICALILSVSLFICGAVKGGAGPGTSYYFFALVFLIVATVKIPLPGDFYMIFSPSGHTT